MKIFQGYMKLLSMKLKLNGWKNGTKNGNSCVNLTRYISRGVISECPRGQYIHGKGDVNACPQGIDTW